jgi:hypothetical protein
MTRRDKDATWRWLDDACRARGWSEGAIEDGIEQRYLRFRGYVQGVGGVSSDTLEADWTIAKMSADDRKLSVFWLDGKLGIVIIQNVKVLLPTDAEVPAPAADAPAASPAPPRKVSEADVLKTVRAIVETHPPGSPPLNEESLHKELENRLGAPVARDRFLAARDAVAPDFKLPVGRPRKSAQ